MAGSGQFINCGRGRNRGKVCSLLCFKSTDLTLCRPQFWYPGEYPIAGELRQV